MMIIDQESNGVMMMMIIITITILIVNMKTDDQESNGVENPSSGSSLTVRSRTTASAASRRSNLEVNLR